MMIEHDPLRRRQRIALQLAAVAERGRIAVVYGGMDCDCVVLRNQVRILPSHVIAYEQFIHALMDDREGAIWFDLVKPSVAADLKVSHRDLVMEAIENGHPGTVRL